MKKIGLMEIFYGRPWPESSRLEFAPFLKELEMQFYLYGPKSDSNLRKNWRNLPSTTELNRLKKIRNAFKNNGIQFGVILSPTELHLGFDQAARSALAHKIEALCDLGLDYLGLFFDDMPSAPDLAARQLEIISSVTLPRQTRLIFCPTFYCLDPMLELLFGEKPPGYLETIGENLPSEIEVLWTGEAIIPPAITAEHLAQMAKILKRSPFICDNFYADDGPIFSNFIKLIAPAGRAPEVFEMASHWAFNPMNQAPLSRIVLAALHGLIHKGETASTAFERALHSAVPKPLADFILTHGSRFAEDGLDALSETERTEFIKRLQAFPSEPVALEIMKWLNGEYAIDATSLL